MTGRVGIYHYYWPGLYDVAHPDVPGLLLGTVILGAGRRWFYLSNDSLVPECRSDGFLTRREATLAMRGLPVTS